jgi:hypothetical protein
MVCLAGAFGGAHDLGEHANENHTERGEAGADYADVDFNVRPVYYFDLVPGWV